MNKQTLFFDLDGTITDSGPGILNSVQYALKKLQLPIPEITQLYSFIGPPLKDSFMKMYKLDEAAANRAIRCYREYYVEKGMYENLVYEGIPELLESLNRSGYTLYVATSKPEVFAKQILDHFDLTKYFKGIYGASLDSSRSSKGAVIRYAMESEDASAADSLMIGDREHDVLGAKENQLDCIGVLYGYGDRAELEAAGAIYLAETPEMIGDFLSNSH